MKTIKILHVIQGFYGGGSGRALVATAKYSSQLGNFQHRILSLAPANLDAVEMAEEAGLSVMSATNGETVLTEIENADIVQLHFWNNPQIYELLRSELPAMRLLIWFHVAGDKPPQIITKELVDYSDFSLAGSPYTYEHPVFQKLPVEVRLKKTGMVYWAADFERVSNVQPRHHDTFNAGYIGQVSFAKMHANYVPMSAQIDIPNVQFIVCGEGIQDDLQQQAQQLGVAQRFDFRGYVEEIKSVIEILDVYGYPLCADTSAASELNLQEVMYAGIPPVVFPYGGVKRLVIDNYTGLIVHSELEYKQAIEYLYHHPEERARLSRNASEYARQIFGAENAAKQLNPIYERLIEWPKRLRDWGIDADSTLLYQPVSLQDLTGQPEELSGAQLFAKSLGNTASEFTVSLTSRDSQQLLEAEHKIAASSTLLSLSEGSILEYRDYYPNDGYLRLWSGLVRQQQGRTAEAVSELIAAINLGLGHWRVSWYLAQVAANANDIPLAEKALYTVVQAEPDFAPLPEMLQRLKSQREQSADITHLQLRDINLIIFPDWSLSEDDLAQEFTRVIRAIATHPDKIHMSLLVDTSNISSEEADLTISGVVMNLLMEENLDISDGPEITLVGQLTQLQWQALLNLVKARIILEKENQQAIAALKVENLPSCEPESLSHQ